MVSAVLDLICLLINLLMNQIKIRENITGLGIIKWGRENIKDHIVIIYNFLGLIMVI